MVDDLREKKLKQEQAAREARIRARNAEKLRLKKLREQFRADGVIRAADARIAADEIQKRKVLEVKREASERTQMCLAEADQKVVDEYWGFHLHKEREWRLAEMARLIYQLRLDTTNEVMRKTESVKPFFEDEVERKKPPSAAPVDPFEGRGPPIYKI
mmetsp:Transcript_9575/g.28075  ORF Transcript_9575/g.28075 Transcript_9575/m.28075 type:complete len:158 (+) Transcript_9575:325-798(+)